MSEDLQHLNVLNLLDISFTILTNHPPSSLPQRPLTRYLPFRGTSLDLRQHIEAAGHSLETCGTHLALDATSCRGYLNKMAGRFHHWNRRWFVFDRAARSLSYYADRSEKKRRGATYFRVSSVQNFQSAKCEVDRKRLLSLQLHILHA